MGWRRCRRFLGAWLGSACILGCGGDVVQHTPGETPSPPPPSGATKAWTVPAAHDLANEVERHDAKLAAAKEPSLAVFDHRELRNLERDGFDLATVGFGWQRKFTGPVDNRSLGSDVGYMSIVNVLAGDLGHVRRGDPLAGVGMRFAHRMFDARWLTGDKFRFELVAVVNRVDRRPFAEGTCGELRFVYRLAYTTGVAGESFSSRLPMTVNVVRWLPGPDCAEWTTMLAKAERAPTRGDEPVVGRESARHALKPTIMAETTLKAVEVNLQSVRWPSTLRPSMAGHVEYLLRVFTRDSNNGPFVASTLENTPDVDQLSRDRSTLAELSEWLRNPAQAVAIEQGTVQVPEKFLAKASTSVAPHGLARRANRPFSALLGEMWQTNASAIRTLRRLDGLSCQGCHQSRSVAGFHVLGEDAPDQDKDRLTSPHSPHVADDLRRRREYVVALSQGTVPGEYRPPAEHPPDAEGWGSRCGLDTSATGVFADWKCGAGFECRAVDDPLVGECLPVTPQTGDACEPGTVKWAGARRDNSRLGPVRDCGTTRVCERNSVGFPGGMCSGGCGDAGDDGNDRAAVCGAIAVLDPFNACVARGEKFSDCLANATRPGALRSCTRDAHCRDDYVCSVTPRGEGGCIPPYFLFQLRVDGHQVE